MKTFKGGKRRAIPKSAQITIIDSHGNVKPPADVSIIDGGTVSFKNQTGIDATIQFTGHKALFHHGTQVDQQPVRHGNSETLTGKGRNKTVHYEVQMTGHEPGRPGNGTIKVGQTVQRNAKRNVVKAKKRARRN